MIKDKREILKSVCSVVASVILSNLIMWAFIHCITEDAKIEDQRVAVRQKAKHDRDAYEADTTIQLYNAYGLKQRYASVDKGVGR